ncbi:hypothetical protein BGX38DRAFT_1143097 [Terfezia claveryi]|nr:hypothetical protein BGX38DRAFT_1143097 [Terfezia claveryi]
MGRKGNAPGYLDSDDEREIDGEERKRCGKGETDEWRDVGEFLLTILANFLNEGGPSGQDGILREILGEDDDEDAAENGEDGKTAVFMRLHNLQEQLEGESNELEGLEKERDSLRKKVTFLELSQEMHMKEEKKGEAGIAGAKLEKLSNFLAEKIRCSPGRPLEILMGAVSDHLVTLEIRSAEDPKFKNLKSETLRKTEKLKKVEAEKKVLVEEKKKLKETLAAVQRELEQARASPYIQPVKRIEVTEVGIQASPVMVDVTTEPQEEIPVEEKKKKRQRQSKGKGKIQKEGAKDRTQIQEDVEMVDEERFAQYEDLSDYEKEKAVKDEAPVTPPITTKQPVVCQTGPKAAKPLAVKYKKPAKPVDTRAFVVHGIPCYRPMADTIQDVRKTGMRGDYWSTLAPGRA